MKRPARGTGVSEEWTPPSGLDRSRPRPVGLTGGGKALVALTFALVGGAVASGVALTSVVIRDIEETRLLREGGKETAARVSGIKRSGREKRRFTLTYAFSVQGESYERQERISARTAERFPVGSILPIRYLPSDPAVNYPRDWRKNVLPPWIPPLASVGLAALAYLCYFQVRNQRRLLAEGRPARGLIRRHSKNQHGVFVHYEFPLLTGSMRTGKSGPVKKPPAVGSAVCVLYDPDQPERNSIYPLSLVRIRTY